MSLVRLLSIALLAAGCATAVPLKVPALRSGPRDIVFSEATRLYQTQSGMMVALVRDDNTNLVKVDARYQSGASSDPAAHAGMAHLVEHLTYVMRLSHQGPTLFERLAQRCAGLQRLHQLG